MSLFAGIYSINPSKPIDHALVAGIKKAIARSGSSIETCSMPHFFLVKFDFGAFGESGYLTDDKKGVAAIVGEPILRFNNEESYSRFTDLNILSKHLSEDKTDVLKSCYGTYALCYYNIAKHSIILAADKLGARPLYYYFNNDFLYFSTSLKILEALGNVPKRLDLQAFVEQLFFFYPLGTRTIYCDVKVLRDGQYLKGKDTALERTYYFRWDRLPIVQKSWNDLLHECYAAFRSAVFSRSQCSHKVFAFLSGGLDSRCLISVLNSLNKEVIAFNSAQPEEQDRVFSEQYATLIGIRYISTNRPLDPSITVGQRAKIVLTGAFERACLELKLSEPSHLMFSGDGGAEVVGFLQMDEVLFDLLREGKFDDAIQHFISHIVLPERILKANLSQEFKNRAFNGMKREFEDLAAIEPERAMYVFLLRNDLRRHLHEYYEDIHEHRIELLLPFYDSRLIEILASAPMPLKPFLYHNFYYKWLQLFPESTRSVPWQTYPNHLPCPLPKAENILSQWQMVLKELAHVGDFFMRKCLRILIKRDFPDPFIKRYVVLLYIIRHSLRFDNYWYLFKFCLNSYYYYSKCTSMALECSDPLEPGPE